VGKLGEDEEDDDEEGGGGGASVSHFFKLRRRIALPSQCIGAFLERERERWNIAIENKALSHMDWACDNSALLAYRNGSLSRSTLGWTSIIALLLSQITRASVTFRISWSCSGGGNKENLLSVLLLRISFLTKA